MRQRRLVRFAKVVALVMIAAVLVTGFASAQSYDPDQDVPHPTKFQKRLDKMSRGLSNILFGWAEIPLAWDRGIQHGQPLTKILTHGTIVGTTKFFMRLGIGVYEFFGFWAENPNGTYDPMIQPEYLF
jgi:putative exosortase-associated protein (TIGR04073 family)